MTYQPHQSEDVALKTGLTLAASIVREEIARAEAFRALEENGRPVFDPAQMAAGIAALQTVVEAIERECGADADSTRDGLHAAIVREVGAEFYTPHADPVERLRTLMTEAAASPGKTVTIPADLMAELAADFSSHNRDAILEIRRREYMPSRDGVPQVPRG